jgi:hypothetical protein
MTHESVIQITASQLSTGLAYLAQTVGVSSAQWSATKLLYCQWKDGCLGQRSRRAGDGDRVASCRRAAAITPSTTTTSCCATAGR